MTGRELQLTEALRDSYFILVLMMSRFSTKRFLIVTLEKTEMQI